jgi:cellulose synthase/poly-beta-1,6-N-acetylglucosamine synthase-like glycosyltransferase
VTVLLTVYNEEDQITERLKNILDSDYPQKSLNVVVASDGSTDTTDEKVKAFDSPNVFLVRPSSRNGKTATQNYALKFTDGEIIIITDADTRFDSACIKNLVLPFSDNNVGGVGGHLLFGLDAGSPISQSQGAYWRQELRLRQCESLLGILAVASGPILAVRRKIFPTMVETVGEDCLIPLEVVSKGYTMKHQATALAYDRMDNGARQEFRTRARMTQRNWQGTWMYPDLLNPFKNFGVALALWNHKVLRWLSPFFLIAWIFSSFAVVIQSSMEYIIPIALAASYCGLFFCILATLGFLFHLMGKNMLFGSSVWTFCLANLGFFVGVLKGSLGQKIKAYR